MTFKVLTFLVAILNAYSTLPTNSARALDTWALRHFVNQSACESDWHAFYPTQQEFSVYLASCALLNDTSLSSSDVQAIVNDLPIDCYPPSASGCIASDKRKR